MTLLQALLIVISLWVAARVASRPFFGLLVMVAVNPLEAFVKLPMGLTLGRLVGALAVLGWLRYLHMQGWERRRIRHGRLKKCVWAFPATCVAGVIVHSMTSDEGTIYYEAFSVVLLALMSVMIEDLVNTRRRVTLLVSTVVLSSVLAAIPPVADFLGLSVYASLGIDPTQAFDGGRAMGFTGNPNALGIVTSTGIFGALVLMSLKRSVVVAAASAGLGGVLTGALLLSGSRTHWVATITCILVFCLLIVLAPRKGRWLSALGGLAFMGLLLIEYQRAPDKMRQRLVMAGSGVADSTVSRQNFTESQMREATQEFFANPLFGNGLGNLVLSQGWRAHDTASMVLGETGIVGGLTLGWLLVACWRWLANGRRVGLRTGDDDLYYLSTGVLATFVAMLAASIGGYIIIYQRWFWITVGIAAVVARWTEEAHRCGKTKKRNLMGYPGVASAPKQLVEAQGRAVTLELNGNPKRRRHV